MTDPNVPPPPGGNQPPPGPPPQPPGTPPPAGYPPPGPPAGQPPAAPPPAAPPPAAPPPAAPPPAQPPGGYAAPPGGYATPAAQPYQGAPSGGAYAEPWKRLVAYIIDVIVLNIVSVPIFLIVGGGVNVFRTSFDFRLVLASLLVYALWVAYFALMISTRGQTLGGMALSVKVISPDGSMPTTEQGFKRAIYHAVSVVPCVGGLLLLGITIWGLVTIFTDPQHRTPWDNWGNTLVVDA